MVAQEASGESVLDQPGAAIRALKAMTAGAAQGQRRIAPPVQEQQRLLPGGEGLGQRRDERRRQKAPALDPLAALIDEAEGGQFGRGMAVRQADVSAIASLGQSIGLVKEALRVRGFGPMAARMASSLAVSSRRRATSAKSWSPAACPRVSLIALK